MGKSARRSIKSDDPSSPSSSPYIFYHHSTNRPDSFQLWSSNLTANDFSSTTKIDSTFGEALSQTKNVENKTSRIETPSHGDVSSSSKPFDTSSETPTKKPATTTYRAFTTTYKSTATARSFGNFTNRSGEMSDLERKTERELLREEFFATYDVMTGIRIAATLGGFFFLMVFLIVYKSRSHSNKALRDPKIQARAAAAVQDEEDREMQEAYEKTAFSLYQDELDVPPMDIDLQRERIVSLGNVSCPPYLLNPNLRFSSIGGYSSLLEPPRRYSGVGRQRRQSNSDSSRILSAYHLNDNYSNQNENFFNESEGEEADDEFDQRFTTTTAEIAYPHGLLSVPRGADSRRSSGMTCCSTESSFLERRCSAITLGLSSYSRASSRRPSRDNWDYEPGYPGINIIEATPKSSPCPSERLTHCSTTVTKDHIKMFDRFKRKRHDDNSIDSITEYSDENIHQCCSDKNELSENLVVDSNSNTPIATIDNINQQPVIRRAPLASLSSFKMSSFECADSDANGSVFDDSVADTDEDMEQFSTDSDEISLQSPPTTDQHFPTHNTQEFNNGKKDERSIKKNCDENVVIVNIEKLDELEDAESTQPTLKNSISVFSSSENVEPCEDIERQQSNDKMSTTHPASYSGCISSSASDKKSNSSECVTINVVEYKNENDENPSVKPSAPSSVILEMPVLAKQNKANSNESVSINPDHSIAGTSRKWSKETLF